MKRGKETERQGDKTEREKGQRDRRKKGDGGQGRGICGGRYFSCFPKKRTKAAKESRTPPEMT